MTRTPAVFPRRALLVALAPLALALAPALAPVLAVVPATAPRAQESEPHPLQEYLWTRRPVVIFANAPQDPRLVRQLAEIERVREELEARDVVVVVDTDPGVSRFETTALRKRYRPHDFNLLLIGKDGEVKRRSPSVVAGAQLVRQIDRLPLRQQEIGR